jgi:pre-mRNA-splicing factor ATP-dependent RNA helicase DHX16
MFWLLQLLEMGRHHGEKSRGDPRHSSKCDRSEHRSTNHDRIKSDSHKDRYSKHHKRSKYESDSDSDDSTEKQRLRDLQERDEFADRLKMKDKEKMRNVAQPLGSGEYPAIFNINHEDTECTNETVWALKCG